MNFASATQTFLSWLLLLSPAYSQVVGGEVQTYFKALGAAPGDLLGSAVAGAGDANGDGVPDFLVSAPKADFGGISDCGTVSLISGLDGSILQRWHGDATASGFGSALAGIGDINGDGFDDCAIGAPEAGGGGKVLALSGIDGSLIFTWDGQPNSSFGISISSAGDYDVDGFPDVIVGAPWDQDGGAAYVYSGRDGANLTAVHGWQFAYTISGFGQSVSSAGDVNGDAISDLIVGARDEIDDVSGGGKAFVFSGVTGHILHRFKWNQYGSSFGASVDGSIDVTLDQCSELIIGDPSRNQVFVYSGRTGEILHRFIRNESSHRRFGFVAKGIADATGDGIADWLIGWPKNGYETGVGWARDAGSIEVVSGVDGSTFWRVDGGFEGMNFGSSIEEVGDLNGDGISEIIVGAPLHDSPNGAVDAGGAYVISFRPYLHASNGVVSATDGGSIQYKIDFPEHAAGFEYKILVSGAGTGPVWHGTMIPLNLDALVYQSFAGQYPFSNANFHGVLDTNGDATATATISANSYFGLVGFTFYQAAIASPVGQLPAYSSVPVSITIVP